LAIESQKNGVLPLKVSISMTDKPTKSPAKLSPKAEETITRFEFTIQQSPEAVFWLDRHGRFSYVNNQACVSLGYTQDELLSLYLWDIDPDYSKDRWEHQWAEMQRAGKRIFETRHQRKDGSIFPLEVLACQINFGGKEFHYAYVRDISERNKAREDQAMLQEQLHQAQKLEALGTLAGGVAHDFNNMLSVIIGYTELLKSRVSDDRDASRDLMAIEKAALRSRDVTRQLLAFSRKQVISPVAMQIDEQIDGTMKMLGRLIGENIELEFAKSESTWKTRLDPSQFDQILVNLAVNARDAMPKGGKLVITTKNVVINEGQAKQKGDCIPGDYVLMSVRDDGIGMSSDTQDRIFEPFFTTKEAGKGTGLGLATIFGIMKQNHGCIELESEPGKGSCFKLYFPRNTAGEDQPETKQVYESGEGAGTVLLVEDDEMVRNMTAKMLERIGYTVVSVASPLQAISYCESGLHTVDLLFTDVVMPKMSGIELNQRLKDTYPDLKVLFMSGYAALVSDRNGVIKPGLNFIQKPFSKNDLALKIKHIIGDLAAEAD